MLQQTRVAAVIPHYQNFLQRFPTVDKLAAAREASVLALWSGLGYYRRARMLHAAAKKVTREHGGKFPDSSEKLRALPGIGAYTSAAIASIAFSEPVAVVDGNVARVLQRLLGRSIAGNEVWKLAEQLLCREEPGNFNQALMELGATVCLPQNPKCWSCPAKKECTACGSVPQLPSKRRRIKRRLFYTLDCRNASVFLVKRSDDTVSMPRMWELPESPRPVSETHGSIRLHHSITVTDFDVLVYRSEAPAGISGRWVKTSRLRTLPLTGLARKTLRAAKVI